MPCKTRHPCHCFSPLSPFVYFLPVIVSLPAVPAPQRTAEEQPDQQEPEFSRKPGKHLSSPVCHTNSSTQGRGSTAHRHSSRMATAEEKHKRCWNGSDFIQNDASISRNLFFALHTFFFLCNRRFKLCAFCPSDFNKFVLKSSYACSISCGHQLFCTVLFVCSGWQDFFFNSVTQSHWVLMTFFCHRHRWCCCWDISFCLNPSCVIKVPLLCISSPSLSENLSCPLMGVYWWVWLIVGFWFAMSFVACSNTRRPLCGALQYSCKREKKKKKTPTTSCLPVWQFKKKKVKLVASAVGRGAFCMHCIRKVAILLCCRDSKSPTFLPVAGLLSSRIRPDCKSLLSNHLLSNTPPPFTHRGPQTTRRNIKQFCR